MITLHAFGPYFGVPDPSGFVMKTMAQLRMSGLPHRVVRSGLRNAPKGKLPYIEDDGVVIADSVFIAEHLRRAHGVDLDAWLTPLQRAQAWALERMLEDHLYWAIAYARYAVDANFEKGPAQFFEGEPVELKERMRDGFAADLYAQGFGRHSEAEVCWLAARDLEAASAILGDGPYLFGDRPCWTDASLWAFTASALCPLFETGVRTAAERHANLRAHKDLVEARWMTPAMAD